MGVLSLALPLVTSHISAVESSEANLVARSTGTKTLLTIEPLTWAPINDARQALPHHSTQQKESFWHPLKNIHNTVPTNSLTNDDTTTYFESLNQVHEHIKSEYQRSSTSTEPAIETIIKHIHDVQTIAKTEGAVSSPLALVLQQDFPKAPRIVPLKYSTTNAADRFDNDLTTLNDATLYQLHQTFDQIGPIEAQKYDGVKKLTNSSFNIE